jgi:hypothetical protein
MRKRKSPFIRAEWAQQKAVERLRICLAEKGYAIFPIAKEHRRHHLDFIAVLKDPPMNFLIVRPTEKGRVSVTPFGPRSQYRYADQAVIQARRGIDIVIAWSRRQLHKPPHGEWWDHYFPRSFRNEVRTILGIEFKPNMT